MRIKRRNFLAGALLGLSAVASYKHSGLISSRKPEVDLADHATEAPFLKPSELQLSAWQDSESPAMLEDLGVDDTSTDGVVVPSGDPQDKVRYFAHDFSDDVFLPEAEHLTLESVFSRLHRAQRLVGHGNFNVLGFDELLKYANAYEDVGAFSRAELDFIEKIFFAQASEYGFFGSRVTDQLTSAINNKDIIKIPHSGHYLFKGHSEAYYQKLKQDIGSNVVLTSGIRSNVKQLYLFLAKASSVSYNLSKASRSLAPPGHSYHGIGDFDVGRVGWGTQNFSDEFAATDEYKRMQDLGYVKIRYTEDNRLGVRFEPWHIKVV